MLTVVVQACGSGDQHEEEKRREAESHAEELCVTEGGHVSRSSSSSRAHFRIHHISSHEFTLEHISGPLLTGNHMRSRRPTASPSYPTKKNQRTDHI